MESTLEEKILGRSESLFRSDVEARREDLAKALVGARVLVIGGAGSIGGGFAKLVARFEVNELILVDPSENNLVEIVRDLRASGITKAKKITTYAIEFGTTEFALWMTQEDPIQYVLNFAAMKHVRSERDPYSLMRLLRVNVLANDLLLDQVSEKQVERVFAVSSDKAVNPASMMGASKAFMERVFMARKEEVHFSRARFANVAFSDGSLLHGFNRRLEKRQAISAPSDIRRFFIAEKEAAELCLLSVMTSLNGEIYYPNLHPEKDLKTFSDIACLVLKEKGYEPVLCDEEDEARHWFNRNPNSGNYWPCLFSRSTTSGEKPYEEFVQDGEQHDTQRFETLGVVTKPKEAPREVVEEVLADLRSVYSERLWDKPKLVSLVKRVVPELNHIETNMSLDQKM